MTRTSEGASIDSPLEVKGCVLTTPTVGPGRCIWVFQNSSQRMVLEHPLFGWQALPNIPYRNQLNSASPSFRVAGEIP